MFHLCIQFLPFSSLLFYWGHGVIHYLFSTFTLSILIDIHGSKISFYLNIFLSFCRNIVCKNVLCESGLKPYIALELLFDFLSSLFGCFGRIAGLKMWVVIFSCQEQVIKYFFTISTPKEIFLTQKRWKKHTNFGRSGG